jgi:hypothetical protein
VVIVPTVCFNGPNFAHGFSYVLRMTVTTNNQQCLNNINRLVLVMEKQCVCCDVGKVLLYTFCVQTELTFWTDLLIRVQSQFRRPKGTATMESNNRFLILFCVRLLVSLMSSFPPLYNFIVFFSSCLQLVLFCFLLPTLLLLILLSLLFIFPYLFFLFLRLFQSANSEYWHTIVMVFTSVHYC